MTAGRQIGLLLFGRLPVYLPGFVHQVYVFFIHRIRSGKAFFSHFFQRCPGEWGDLANNKIRSVTLCPIRPISALLAQDPAYRSRKALEPVRRGIVASLHLLGNPDTPGDNQTALYLDFRQLVILLVGYLQRHAASLGQILQGAKSSI